PALTTTDGPEFARSALQLVGTRESSLYRGKIASLEIVEVGFVVPLFRCEFLTGVVGGAVALSRSAAAYGDVLADLYLFAEWQVVVSRDHCPIGVCHYPGAGEVVGCQIADPSIRSAGLAAVFGYQLATDIIHENRGPRTSRPGHTTTVTI